MFVSYLRFIGKEYLQKETDQILHHPNMPPSRRYSPNVDIDFSRFRNVLVSLI